MRKEEELLEVQHHHFHLHLFNSISDSELDLQTLISFQHLKKFEKVNTIQSMCLSHIQPIHWKEYICNSTTCYYPMVNFINYSNLSYHHKAYLCLSIVKLHRIVFTLQVNILNAQQLCKARLNHLMLFIHGSLFIYP